MGHFAGGGLSAHTKLKILLLNGHLSTRNIYIYKAPTHIF